MKGIALYLLDPVFIKIGKWVFGLSSLIIFIRAIANPAKDISLYQFGIFCQIFDIIVKNDIIIIV